MNTSTSAYQLMELTALSGECSIDVPSHLNIGQSYQEKLITQLKEKGLIKTHYKDKLRGYRLTAKGKTFLLHQNIDRFSFYLEGNSDTNRPRSDLPRRLRLQQAFLTYTLLLQADVQIFRDEKPNLFGEKSDGIRQIAYPVFYHSREMKELGAETIKIANSRIMGILLAKNCIYAVFYTRDSLMKWEYRTELKVKALLSYHTGRGLLSKSHLFPGYPPDAPIRALLIGTGMDTALKLMTSTGEFQKSYFFLDGSFDYFHYVPHTPAGVSLLRLLCSPELQEALARLLLSDLSPPCPDYGLEHDAVSDGMPVLLAFDFDMLRITRFYTALSLRDLEGNLICFDFQREVLQAYFGDLATITTIDLKKFEGRFYH